MFRESQLNLTAVLFQKNVKNILRQEALVDNSVFFVVLYNIENFMNWKCEFEPVCFFD